jgi:hypothetical protein
MFSFGNISIGIVLIVNMEPTKKDATSTMMVTGLLSENDKRFIFELLTGAKVV